MGSVNFYPRMFSRSSPAFASLSSNAIGATSPRRSRSAIRSTAYTLGYPLSTAYMLTVCSILELELLKLNFIHIPFHSVPPPWNLPPIFHSKFCSCFRNSDNCIFFVTAILSLHALQLLSN